MDLRHMPAFSTSFYRLAVCSSEENIFYSLPIRRTLVWGGFTRMLLLLLCSQCYWCQAHFQCEIYTSTIVMRKLRSCVAVVMTTTRAKPKLSYRVWQQWQLYLICTAVRFPRYALFSVEVDILFSPQPIGSEHENRDLQHLSHHKALLNLPRSLAQVSEGAKNI